MKFSQSDVQNKLFECLNDGKEVYRKVLIREVVSLFNLAEEELTNSRPDSLVNRLMSNVGSVITKMINDGDLMLSEGKKLSLTRYKTIIVDESKIENFVLSQIAQKGNLSLTNLLELAQKHFKTSKTDTLSDDDALDVELKNVLKKLTDSKVIALRGHEYHSLTRNQPLTPIGACIEASLAGEHISKSLIDAINVMGGEFFEVFSVNLFKEYFRLSGYRLLSARVTGGTNDNGIDGIILARTPLGYDEKIYMQCKVRKSAEVTLNEVRQFAGAFYGERATRGIFITNNVFHHDAYDFLRKVRSTIIGVDKTKLVDLATDCMVGVRTEGSRLVLDEGTFLQAPQSACRKLK